jgi:hypothetical protein
MAVSRAHLEAVDDLLKRRVGTDRWREDDLIEEAAGLRHLLARRAHDDGDVALTLPQGTRLHAVGGEGKGSDDIAAGDAEGLRPLGGIDRADDELAQLWLDPFKRRVAERFPVYPGTERVEPNDWSAGSFGRRRVNGG